MSQQKVKSVTFIQQLKKSWKVTYTGVNFKNERGAHVETNGWQPKLNTPYPLGARTVKPCEKGNVAVFYDVKGAKNGRHTAHFTNYFGPAANASKY